MYVRSSGCQCFEIRLDYHPFGHQRSLSHRMYTRTYSYSTICSHWANMIVYSFFFVVRQSFAPLSLRTHTKRSYASLRNHTTSHNIHTHIKWRPDLRGNEASRTAGVQSAYNMCECVRCVYHANNQPYSCRIYTYWLCYIVQYYYILYGKIEYNILSAVLNSK